MKGLVLLGLLFLTSALAVRVEASGQAGFPIGPQIVSLDGNWKYTPLARTTLKPNGSIVDDTASTTSLPAPGTMPIPSNWHLQGLANFNGRVRFERDFSFSRKLTALDRVFLVFHGVDYFADVALNGEPAGKHEGYFQSFEFDVTGKMRRGANHLMVTVDAPLEEPGTVWPDHKRVIKGVLTHWDCKPGGADDPKVGQDGTSAGIWNSVALEVRHAAWLGNVKLQPYLYDRKLTPGHEKDEGLDAKIFITAEVRATSPGWYTLTAEVPGVDTAKVSLDLNLPTPEATAVLVLPMEQPHLWWTWDLGEPYLYTCRLTLSTSGTTGGAAVYQREVRFGVRTITLDEKTGDWRLNGMRFFIRGTSIVPDMWLAHYTPDRITQDVKLLRQANINGVRVCVQVNREELYDALDRAGIVAWQDFPLQWDYTHTDDLMLEAARQLRDMIRQFYNHPSIITWVCQNESTAYNVNVLDPFLARVGAQEDSSRPVRPVSAFNEHYYEGWYGGDYHNYRSPPGGPIISELGAQALPSLEEVKEMVGDAWPPDWAKMAYHDFQYDQTFKVAKIPMPTNWAAFVENSQRYQAELLQYAIEHYRREKYKKIGSFFQFEFVDCWPGITWSVVSYARQPKLGYFAVRRAFQPILIEADLDRIVWSLGKDSQHLAEAGLDMAIDPWVVNDEHRQLAGARCEVSLRGQGQDTALAAADAKDPIPSDGVIQLPKIYATLPINIAPGGYQLVLRLKQGDNVLSENEYPISVVE
ncbi:MAG TPA: glycoside hydrolase family 2 TIM barrel-domain containing protein [Terriglobia bacterium]|nr:glycoside hydrolase family 2 TIM barrel-domain containing protein [Terriglobia bacterium]